MRQFPMSNRLLWLVPDIEDIRLTEQEQTVLQRLPNR